MPLALRCAPNVHRLQKIQIDFAVHIHYIIICERRTAPCILPPCSSGRNLNSCLWLPVLKFGSYAMIPREPCQIGNKAALSGPYHVP